MYYACEYLGFKHLNHVSSSPNGKRDKNTEKGFDAYVNREQNALKTDHMKRSSG